MAPDGTGDGPDTTAVTCRVVAIVPSGRGRVHALASVEILIEGVTITLNGIQVCREMVAAATGPCAGTVVELPKYRAPDGVWRSALVLPDELKRPMAEAVLSGCIDDGLLVQRSALGCTVAKTLGAE